MWYTVVETITRKNSVVMKQFLFGCVLLAPLLGAGQTFESAYDRTGFLTGAISVAGGVEDEDGNLLFAYSGGGDLYLLKTTPVGDIIWNRRFDFGENEGFYHHGVAANGERYALAGFSIGNATASRDGVLIITDKNGLPQTTRRMDQSEGSNAFHAICSVPGGFAMAGRVAGPGSYDFHVTRIDLNGGLLWSKTFGSPGWDWLRTIAPAGDGVVVAGNSQDGFSGQAWDGIVMRFDADGELLWSLVLDTEASDDLMGVVHDPGSGSVFVCGLGGVGMNGILVRIDDTTGLLEWARMMPNNLVAQSVVPLGNGHVQVLSQPWNIAGGLGDFDMMLSEFDEEGQELWSRLFGGASHEYVSSMIRVDDGGMLMTTLSGSFGQGGNNIFVAKADVAGETSCSDVSVRSNWIEVTPQVIAHTLVQGSDDLGVFNYNPSLSEPVLAVIGLCCAEPVSTAFDAWAGSEDPREWGFSYTGGTQGTLTWDFGDGSEEGVGDAVTHTYAEAGTYTVCLTVEGVCDTGMECREIVVSGVGMSERLGQGWSIYPNPANGSVRFSTSWSGTARMDLLNAQGGLVRAYQVPDLGSGVLGLDGVAPGLYWLRIARNEHPVFTPVMVVVADR